MKALPFMYCILLTGVLAGLYVVRHNRLTELRIHALSLEKGIKVEEAEAKRLEVELARFFCPLRLEELARRAQYAHLKAPSLVDVMEWDDREPTHG